MALATFHYPSTRSHASVAAPRPCCSEQVPEQTRGPNFVLRMVRCRHQGSDIRPPLLRCVESCRDRACRGWVRADAVSPSLDCASTNPKAPNSPKSPNVWA